MNDQDDLHDDLQDGLDPNLQQLYRQFSKEQPSAELDKKILAAAKITKPLHVQKKTHHWQAPFALAASVVLVSSVVLYLHEENPAAFDAKTESTQAPTTNMPRPESAPTEMAKPAVDDATITHNPANTNVLADNTDQKTAPNKAKDIPIIQPEKAQTASANALDDHLLTAQAEKKAEMTHRADQVAEANFANQAEKLVQANNIAKGQETQRAKVENDQSLAASPAPVPMIAAPVQQMQPQPEVAERHSIPASRLQNSNHASQQYSVANTESDKPFVEEKSSDAATMTSPTIPMNTGLLSGAAASIAKQRIKRDETTESTYANYAQSISAPVLSIEGVAMGMSRDQLVAQGVMCYVDVCHLDLSQPEQKTYWGILAQNAHLTAFLSHQVVTKLVLQQKNTQLDQVKTALSNVGIASQQSCIEEKGTLLISRQLGSNYLNVRSMGVGLSLAICQQTRLVK